jgi:hypothetical protein
MNAVEAISRTALTNQGQNPFGRVEVSDNRFVASTKDRLILGTALFPGQHGESAPALSSSIACRRETPGRAPQE